MLFGWHIEAKQSTILKGINNFFFLLYHLWYVYAFFTYAQVKYPLGFPLIMINILVFFKGISIFIKWYIYIYIYIYSGGMNFSLRRYYPPWVKALTDLLNPISGRDASHLCYSFFFFFFFKNWIFFFLHKVN